MIIKYFSWVRENVGTSEEVINIPDEINTADKLIDYLINKDQKYKKAFKKRKTIKIALNKEYITKTTRIKNEDEIAFFPPVTGGWILIEKFRIKIQHEDFNVEKENKLLFCYNTGAIVNFVGIVREQHKNKNILSMFLEHYPKMTENEILKTLLSVKKNKTIIVIAHRLKTIENCDKIIELDNGKIKKIATPNEILKNYVK